MQSWAISLNSLNSLLPDITEPLNFTAACPAIAFGEGGCRNKKPTQPPNRKDKKMKNNLKQHDKINIMVPFFVIIQVFICNNLPIAAVSS